MNNITYKHDIFDEVRGIDEYRNYTNLELNYKIFKHTTGNRLTYDGVIVLQSLYDSYKFTFETNSLTTRHLIAIAREIRYPYYLSKSTLILFHGEDAFVLKMLGSDVKAWLEKV